MADLDELRWWNYITGIAAYTVAVLGTACSAVLWLVKRQRSAITALEAKVERLEKEAVTVGTFKESLHEVLDRFDERWSNYMDRIDERFAYIDSRQTDLKQDLKDVILGQATIRDSIRALPCPRPPSRPDSQC